MIPFNFLPFGFRKIASYKIKNRIFALGLTRFPKKRGAFPYPDSYSEGVFVNLIHVVMEYKDMKIVFVSDEKNIKLSVFLREIIMRNDYESGL